MNAATRSNLLRVLALSVVVLLGLAFAAPNAEAGLDGHLTVSNHSCEAVNVFLNGRHVGWVNGNGTYTFSVHEHHCLTIQVRKSCGQLVFSRYYGGHYHHLSVSVH